MPGWYYTVESTSAKHLISQFKDAIQGALSCEPETRAKMRAVSAKQRFPVARWVEEIGDLHKMSVHKSHKHRDNHLGLARLSRAAFSRPASPSPSEPQVTRPVSPASFMGPELNLISPTHSHRPADEGTWPLPLPSSALAHNRRFSNVSIQSITRGRTDFALQKVDPFFTDADGEYTNEFKQKLTTLDAKNSETDLCIEQHLVRSEKKWFEDYKREKLGLGSSSRNASKRSLALEGHTGTSTRAAHPVPQTPSRFLDVPTASRPQSPSRPHTLYSPSVASSMYSTDNEDSDAERPGRGPGEGYVSVQFDTDDSSQRQLASPIQRLMLRKVFDWPVYTIILALGQILGANSYQISLLNGEQGQRASMLYTIASIYGGMSVVWWFAFRRFKSVWILSAAFAVYGVAFIFVGCAPFAKDSFLTRGWLQNTASGLYAAAASSGSMFFALNFGDEGMFDRF